MAKFHFIPSIPSVSASGSRIIFGVRLRGNEICKSEVHSSCEIVSAAAKYYLKQHHIHPRSVSEAGSISVTTTGQMMATREEEFIFFWGEKWKSAQKGSRPPLLPVCSCSP